jgi:hypothetical protein
VRAETLSLAGLTAAYSGNHMKATFNVSARDLVRRTKEFATQPSNRTMKLPAPLHVYEVRPRKDDRRVDLISDAPPFSRLWYEQALDTIRQTVPAAVAMCVIGL